MKMVHYRWPVEIVRAHFALQVLILKSLESFLKILKRTVVNSDDESFVSASESDAGRCGNALQRRASFALCLRWKNRFGFLAVTG